VHPKDPSEARLWHGILENMHKTLCADEIVVVDAGVKVRDLQEAGLERYVTIGASFQIENSAMLIL
jgi:hypothetical protein